MTINHSRESSNAWLMMSALLIAFFLFQYIQTHIIVLTECEALYEFWLSKDLAGLNVFSIFIAIFLLFGLWAVVEIYAAHVGDFEDKPFCTVVSVLVIICVVATMAAFRAQWESYEVEWGERSFRDLTFQLSNSPEEKMIDYWSRFLKEKHCENPYFYMDLDSDAKWEELKREFIEGGGTFLWEIPI